MKNDCFYDEQESRDNAMACAQIELDKQALEADLYCIGMQSEVAYKRMPAICKAMGVNFPPRNIGVAA